MSQRVIERLQAQFGTAILETHAQRGDDTAVVAPESWFEVCAFCKNQPDLAFDMVTDLCGVDYPDRLPRIEVVLHLYSVRHGHRVRLKARIGDADLDENPTLASVVSLWPGADWLERETYDMMGVIFRGHPDLRRILMYPEFEGHPLRKDYPAQRTQPLVPYRTEEEAGLPLGKLAPFGADEGMSFGRERWIRQNDEGELVAVANPLADSVTEEQQTSPFARRLVDGPVAIVPEPPTLPVRPMPATDPKSPDA